MFAKIFVVSLLLGSSIVKAADIGFGHIYAIKNYNFSTYKAIKIYLEADSTHIEKFCLNDRGLIEAEILFTPDNERFVERTLSIALSAYHANKKVRLYSESSSCKIDFIAIEDSYL